MKRVAIADMTSSPGVNGQNGAWACMQPAPICPFCHGPLCAHWALARKRHWPRRSKPSTGFSRLT